MNKNKKSQFAEVSTSSPVNKWEADMVVEGKFQKLKTIVTQFGKGDLVDIETEDGTVETYGSPVILSSKLRGIPVGTTVRIECLGKVRKTPAGVAWDFRVYAKDWNPEENLPF